ncbi:hypothetical protein SAMN04488581_2474 [Mycolicibacterium neoaurum]|jgi:hypothetical protein|uniref:hypothetical protein n=1 Tax=Mycolicibacterium neoaurum TaxID=1795 RepID=UPI000568D2CB|nr:hypothetical protein [Mycolicibacterium neoaurum]QVI29962.1 hypothetical protein MN2019_12095 [Mycolicibacterium neoaurum]SDD53174.1 hypothetical protein SAMN04488581_2474 [Mycolicibacterium neoaurum]
MTSYPRLGVGLALAALSVTLLSGCSKIDQIQRLTDVASTAVEHFGDAAGKDMLAAESIDKALAAISAKVGADPMQVVELVFTELSVTVQAVDPAAPTELNQWTYTAGAVGPLRPVDYGDDAEALRQNLFSVAEVPTGAIVTAIDNAVDASGIVDGTVQSVVVKRNLPFTEQLHILLNVQGERSSKQVRTDLAGTVTDIV